MSKSERHPLILSRLTVRNYRSIKEETFEFGNLAALIGKNNVGKSNIMAAVSLLLEGTPKSLSERDFHREGEGIEIVGTLTNAQHYLALCDQRHRTKIEKCIPGEGPLRIRRLADPKALLGKLEIWDPDKGEFGTPTGIEAGLRQILPDVIHIDAFVNPVPEAEGKTSATLGKILKVILDSVRTQAEAEVGESLARAKALLNVQLDEHGEATSDVRAPALREVEKRFSQFLGEAFEGSRGRIHVDLPELPTLLVGARVELHDGGDDDRWTQPQHKGQGLQRALYVALLRTLAEQKRAAEEGEVTKPFILFMEEPEAFLHPSAHGVLRAALETISAADQVIFATHSPTMVSPQRVAGTVLVRKDAGCTTRLQPLGDQLRGADKRIRHLFEYARSSKFLFADRVIVVEGPSDIELLEAMCVQCREATLEELGSACIDAESKDNVSECMQILRQVGLPAKGLVDLDFLWRGAGSLFKADVAYSRFCQSFWDLCEQEGISERGARSVSDTQKKTAAGLIDSNLAAERDQLRSRLREDRGMWVLARGEIEDYAAISKTGKSEFAEAARGLRTGERHIVFREEIEDLIEWLGAGD